MSADETSKQKDDAISVAECQDTWCQSSCLPQR